MATEIVCKILNQAGAEIHVLKTPGRDAHGWQCTGCALGDDPENANWQVETARGAAQRHADKCRFLPA